MFKILIINYKFLKIFINLKKRKIQNHYIKINMPSNSFLSDYSNFIMISCRKTRKIFDDCMKKNLNLERPSFGYFCEAKVHDSPRPKPPKEKTEYPDRVPEPVAPPYPPSKYQGRQGFNI